MTNKKNEGNGKPYIDPEAGKLFDALLAKYGTHQGAAQAMRMNRRMYASWRYRGLSTGPKWERAKTILRLALRSE